MRSTLAFESVTMMLPTIRLTASLPVGESSDLSCSSSSSQNLMLSDLLIETLAPSAPAPPAGVAPPAGALGPAPAPPPPLLELDETVAALLPFPLRVRRT